MLGFPEDDVEDLSAYPDASGLGLPGGDNSNAEEQAAQLIGPDLLYALKEEALNEHRSYGGADYLPPVFDDPKDIRVEKVLSIRDYDVSGRKTDKPTNNVTIELTYSPKGARALYGVDPDAGKFVLWAN